MKWVRIAIIFAALAMTTNWAVSAFVCDWYVTQIRLRAHSSREGVYLALAAPRTQWYPPGLRILQLPSGPFWSLPTFETYREWQGLSVPHWLINLIAWSLFYVLWRKARRHPKGHCQTCGYDLTGSATGKCSECGKADAAR